MSYRIDKQTNELVIDGWEKGIAQSPYTGIANIRNLNTSYYPGVAYVNYRRRAATLSEIGFFAGIHSVDNGGNSGWTFNVPTSAMTNPVSKAVSPSGLIYIQDDSGEIWKQSAVNSTVFNILQGGAGRFAAGNAGIAWWNNYLAVFGGGVIEFCGDGSGDAGIVSTNWNINYDIEQVNSAIYTTQSGSSPAYVFTSFPYYPTALPVFQVGDSVTFSSTGTLSSPLIAGTTYYIANMIRTAGGHFGVSYRQEDINQYLTGAIVTATSANLNTAYTGTTGTYEIIFDDGSTRSVTITNGSAALSWSGAVTAGATIHIVLKFTSDGTGVQTVTDTQKVLPLGNATSVLLKNTTVLPYATLTFDDKSGTFGSYVDPVGNTVIGNWKGATGNYYLVTSNGEKALCNLVNGSPTVTFATPLQYLTGSTITLQLINTSVTDYRPYVSKNSANLLFANGADLGQIIYVPGVNNLAFSPGIPVTQWTAQNKVVSLPDQYDTIADMTDLLTNLVIAGQRSLYTWDYNSGSVTSPTPCREVITRIHNVLNNIYILAGQKGNIYVSNGYSVQLLQRLSDYISGVIDPVWSFGDMMNHRSKVYFQALAKSTAGSNLIAGIFSLLVSPSLLGEQSSGLVMEAQNSYGVTPASGSISTGLLIDATPSSSGQDSYYSAWSNGASTGGIDYNDTSLWQNNEPVIETDIVPMGSILDKKTLGQIQFKNDRPMATGDSISLYARPSLSDSYTLIGTTTTNQLSEYFPANLAQSQWMQFKITFKCASSGSSFIPLRELRVQML